MEGGLGFPAMEAREGFSIREYVLEMRSVSVAKSWPFDETSAATLPPITVKKFVCWIDCLHYLESESSQKKALSDADVSDSEAIGVINARLSRSLKAKTPKKKSILEIFAAAPPVERVSTDEEDNSFHEEDEILINSKVSGHDEINWGFEGKKQTKKKIKKYKQILSSKLKKATKVIKKTTSSHKENCIMQKLQDQDKSVENRNSSCIRENKNDIHNQVSIYKKNPRQQHLDAAKNTTSCKAFRLIAQNQHPTNLKPGILKSHPKAFSLQQPAKCMLQKADKHVTFLEKTSPLEECSKLQPCSVSDLRDAHHLGSSGKDSTIMENRMEDVVDCRRPSNEQSTIHSCPVDVSTSCDPECVFPPRFSSLPYMEVTTIPSCSTSGIFIKDLGATYNVLPVSNMAKIGNKISQLGFPAENIYGKRIDGVNEDFVGLPLNSRGELFMLNGKGSVNEMMARNTAASPSISTLSVADTFSKWDCRTSSRDNHSSSGYLKENQLVFFPSRLDTNEYQGNRKNGSHRENSPCKQIPEAYRNEKILSTMRLMGKEFIVGGQGFQEFENGDIWKDKQILDELHLPVQDRDDPSSVKLRETFFRPLGITVNPGSSNMASYRHFDRSYRGLSQGESSFPKLFPSRCESQSDFHGSRSTVKFSLMQSDLEEHGGPHTNRSPFFLDVLEKDTSMNKLKYHYNYVDSPMPGTNHWANSCMNNSLFGSTLQSPIEASPVPTFLTEKVPVLSYPAVRKRHGNQKSRERIKSRIGSRACVHGGINKKQPPAVSNVSLKTANAPTCVLLEGAQCDNVNFGDVQTIETTESCGHDQNDRGIHSWTNSCSCSCTAKAGPIKLAPGFVFSISKNSPNIYQF